MALVRCCSCFLLSTPRRPPTAFPLTPPPNTDLSPPGSTALLSSPEADSQSRQVRRLVVGGPLESKPGALLPIPTLSPVFSSQRYFQCSKPGTGSLLGHPPLIPVFKISDNCLTTLTRRTFLKTIIMNCVILTSPEAVLR